MIRRLYRAVVPEPARLSIGRFRRRLPRIAEDIRWKVMGPRGVSGFVEKSLDPGPYSWVFILGCNNSGTTLLAEILGEHRLVRTRPKEEHA